MPENYFSIKIWNIYISNNRSIKLNEECETFTIQAIDQQTECQNNLPQISGPFFHTTVIFDTTSAHSLKIQQSIWPRKGQKKRGKETGRCPYCHLHYVSNARRDSLPLSPNLCIHNEENFIFKFAVCIIYTSNCWIRQIRDNGIIACVASPCFRNPRSIAKPIENPLFVPNWWGSSFRWCATGQCPI